MKALVNRALARRAGAVPLRALLGVRNFYRRGVPCFVMNPFDFLAGSDSSLMLPKSTETERGNLRILPIFSLTIFFSKAKGKLGALMYCQEARKLREGVRRSNK